MIEENIMCIACGHTFGFEEMVIEDSDRRAGIRRCPKCGSSEMVVQEKDFPGEWRDAKTDPPQLGVPVLIWPRFGYSEMVGMRTERDTNWPYTDYVIAKGSWVLCGRYSTPINPTHWMPIPEGPKEIKEGK